MSDLEDFLNSLPKCKRETFEPGWFWNEAGKCIEIYFSSEPFYAIAIPNECRIYVGRETGRITGFVFNLSASPLDFLSGVSIALEEAKRLTLELKSACDEYMNSDEHKATKEQSLKDHSEGHSISSEELLNQLRGGK